MGRGRGSGPGRCHRGADPRERLVGAPEPRLTETRTAAIDLNTDALVLPARAPLPVESNTRSVSLNELDSRTVFVSEDGDGNVVLDPNGEEASRSSTTSTGGQLDVDSNIGCQNDGSVENVFWPEGQAPLGEYTIVVQGFQVGDSCGSGDYELTVRTTGQGDQTFSGTVAHLFVSRAGTPDTSPVNAFSTLAMNISVTSTPTCQFPAGTSIPIDLGAVAQSAFVEGEIPEEFRDEALEGEATRLMLVQDSPPDLDWVFISPAGAYGSFAPGEHQGQYRVGDEVALFDTDGTSSISGTDFATAVVDEVEGSHHHRAHIGIAY